MAGLPLDDPWAALGDPTRREVLRRVAQGPRSVADIARGLPVSRPAVSQHLRILAAADLVVARPRGRQNIYQVQPEGFRRLRADLERFWSDALINLKNLAEAGPVDDDPNHPANGPEEGPDDRPAPA